MNRKTLNAEDRKTRDSARQKEWRAANSERIKEYRKAYRAANSDKLREADRTYRKENKEKISEKNKEYRSIHKNEGNALSREWRKNNPGKRTEIQRRYRGANQQKVKEQKDKWRHEHPESTRGQRQRRRARELGATVDKFMAEEIFDRDKWRCQLCGRMVDKKLKHPNHLSASLDHIIPLSQGGLHSRANTQLAHLICNIRAGVGGVKQTRLL